MGRTSFGCILVQDFLFWANTDNPKLSICEPLIEEPNHFNIQIEPLVLYQVTQAKGLDFIEPIPLDDLYSGSDSRLDHFFAAEGASAHA